MSARNHFLLFLTVSLLSGTVQLTGNTEMNKQDLQMINSPGLQGDLDQTAKMVLKAVKDGELTGEVKFDIFAIPQSDPVLDKAKEAARRFAEIKEKLRGCGLKVGITVQFVLHGDRGCTVSDPKKYPRCIDLKGEPTRRICPFGKNIQKYTYDIFRIFAQTHPDMIDMDEDIRVESKRECFCPEHMKHFNALKGGKAMTREELVPLLQSPGKENAKIKELWHQTIVDSVVEVAKAARAGIDSVDPEIPCYNKIIASELSIAIPVTKVLAGKHSIVARVNNSFYGVKNMEFLPSRMLGTAYQAYYLRQAGAQRIRSESDACPQTRFACSARKLHSQMTGSVLTGVDDLEMRDMNPPEDRAHYSESHSRHAGFYRTLAKWCKEVEWQGFSIPFPKELRSCWDFENCDAQNHWFFGGEFCGRLGFPTRLGNQDGVMLISDQVIDAFSDDEVKTMLGKAVVLTGEAAMRLQKRGFGKELGVTLSEDKIRVDGMFFSNDASWNGKVAGKRGRINNGRLIFKTLKPGPKTEIIGNYFTIPHSFSSEYKMFAPSETAFKNELGGTVIVMADSYFESDFFHKCAMINLDRKEQFATWYHKLTGEKLVYAAGNYDCWIRRGKFADGKREMVSVINLNCDPMLALVLANMGSVSKVEKLMPDGTLKETSFKVLEDGSLRISGRHEILDPSVYLITK